MKLRAIIYGMQEYEEAACDYVNGDDAVILAAQCEIARDDPVSFVNPDNVRVVVGPADTEGDNIDAEVALRHLSWARNDGVIPSASIKDPQIRLHWAAAMFHLDQIAKLVP
jgi:hypothetical protein